MNKRVRDIYSQSLVVGTIVVGEKDERRLL